MLSYLERQNIFNDLYEKIDGYSASFKAKGSSQIDSSNFYYGEILFDSWEKIINKTNPKEGSVFIDLGSGTGRNVVASHLTSKFRKSIGVEILGGLHDTACQVKESFLNINQQQEFKDKELIFLQEDIFKVDLKEADLILLNLPFKGEEKYLELEGRFLKELKPETKILSVIRPLRDERFKRISTMSVEFSWGPSTIYLSELS